MSASASSGPTTRKGEEKTAWVVDYFPHERAIRHPDGTSDVTLAITALPWLARLLLRLGPEAEILDVDGGPPDAEALIRGLRADTAGRILARYGR